jgi:hypothetical protein
LPVVLAPVPGQVRPVDGVAAAPESGDRSCLTRGEVGVAHATAGPRAGRTVDCPAASRRHADQEPRPVQRHGQITCRMIFLTPDTRGGRFSGPSRSHE